MANQTASKVSSREKIMITKQALLHDRLPLIPRSIVFRIIN